MFEWFLVLFFTGFLGSGIFAVGFHFGKKSYRKKLKRNYKTQSAPVQTGKLKCAENVPTVVQISRSRLDASDILNAEVIE